MKKEIERPVLYVYKLDDLIAEWLAKFPEDKDHPDLLDMVKAGHVYNPTSDTYRWASYVPFKDKK